MKQFIATISLFTFLFLLRFFGLAPFALAQTDEFVCQQTFTATVSTTPTPTITPPADCKSYAVHETCHQGTRFITYELDPLNIAHLDTFCPFCDVGSMDDHPVTGVVYVIPNDEQRNGARLCILDKTTGAFEPESCKSTDERITGLSFRKSDNSLWAWKDGAGLITINTTDGSQSPPILSSPIDIQGIAWDNNSTFLYAAKDNGRSNNSDLYKYDPSTGSFGFVWALTLEQTSTDALDFSPDGWLVGNHKTTDGVKIFAYNVATNQLSNTSWTISPTNFNNMEAMTAMCPLNIGPGAAAAAALAINDTPVPTPPIDYQHMRVNINDLNANYKVSVSAKLFGTSTFTECFSEIADFSPIGTEPSPKICGNLTPRQAYVYKAMGLDCTTGTCYPVGASVESEATVPNLSTVVLNIDLAGTSGSPASPLTQTGVVSGTINITSNSVAYSSVGSWICEVDSQTLVQKKETCQSKWITGEGFTGSTTSNLTNLPFSFDGLALDKLYEVAIGVYDFSGNIAKLVGSSDSSIDCPTARSVGYEPAQSNYCPVAVGDVQNFTITLSETPLGGAEITSQAGITNQEFAAQIQCYANATCTALDVSRWISEIACHVPGLQQQTCDPTRGECQMLTVPPCLYRSVSL